MLTPKAHRDIQYIIVHHAATDPDNWVDAAEIHAWHTQDRKWAGIGYNYVVCTDGTIEPGRPEYWVGAHTRGQNRKSIGVCLIGTGFPKSESQRQSATALIKALLERYPEAQLKGHSDFANTECPGFDVNRLLC